MFRLFLILIAVAQISILLVPTTAQAEPPKIVGLIVGRTGETLHISVPQPVREDTIFAVKLIERDKPIAEARVLSCTKERPYMALAKLVRGGIETAVPIGVRAYADAKSVSGPDAPMPMKHPAAADDDRFSLQTGAFYPSTPALRDNITDYWQAYRLNYSFLKAKGFEAMLSAEYTKGTGDFILDGTPAKRSMEIIPVTMLGKIRPISIGNTHFFLGAGGGMYRIRSEQNLGGRLTADSTDEFGYELAAGLESRHGWAVELRYRDIPDTNIKGYSLGIGSRF